MTEHELNELTGSIIGVAIDVHRELGPGLLERVYQRCLKIALEEAGYTVKSELSIPIIFRGKVIDDELLTQGIKRIKNGFLSVRTQ